LKITVGAIGHSCGTTQAGRLVTVVFVFTVVANQRGFLFITTYTMTDHLLTEDAGVIE
jgi:hypothetical protein